MRTAKATVTTATTGMMDAEQEDGTQKIPLPMTTGVVMATHNEDRHRGKTPFTVRILDSRIPRALEKP
ncbi:hypothetical protein A2U01_0098639, partial [Trifolium medium]|nr:hypothetical protein [Trifolium medium]